MSASDWRRIIQEVPLRAGIVHAWMSELSLTSEAALDLRLLTLEEKIRADRFHFIADRARWIQSRTILRYLVAAYLGLAPDAVRFAADRAGKLFLVAKQSVPLQFNLSHTSDRVVVAFAFDQPVGVDIECIDRFQDFDSAVRFLSSRELEKWADMTNQERMAAFWRSWCIKEAYAKARGSGVELNFREIESNLGLLTEIIADGSTWQVRSIDCGPTHELAVALRGTFLTVKTFHV